MKQERYYFGTRLAKRLDYYAFPRTGSHYLWAGITGLFDLVFFENEYVDAEEPKQRMKELNPSALYALKLRADGIPFQPVYFNAAPNGMHGMPIAGDYPTLLLIREPLACIYSLFKTATDRWGLKEDDPVSWIHKTLEKYREFYRATYKLLKDRPDDSLLVRFEHLQDSADELRKLVDFVGVTPKLDSDYVYYWTRFERLTREGQRTFYRKGDNEAWKADKDWRKSLEKAEVGDFAEFGY